MYYRNRKKNIDRDFDWVRFQLNLWLKSWVIHQIWFQIYFPSPAVKVFPSPLMYLLLLLNIHVTRHIFSRFSELYITIWSWYNFICQAGVRRLRRLTFGDPACCFIWPRKPPRRTPISPVKIYRRGIRRFFKYCACLSISWCKRTKNVDYW